MGLKSVGHIASKCSLSLCWSHPLGIRKPKDVVRRQQERDPGIQSQDLLCLGYSTWGPLPRVSLGIENKAELSQLHGLRAFLSMEQQLAQH